MGHETLPQVPDFYESDPSTEFGVLLDEVYKRFHEAVEQHDLSAPHLSFLNQRVGDEVRTIIHVAEKDESSHMGDILVLKIPVEEMDSRRPQIKAGAPYFYVSYWSPDENRRQLDSTKIDLDTFRGQYFNNPTAPIADLFGKVSRWTLISPRSRPS